MQHWLSYKLYYHGLYMNSHALEPTLKMYFHTLEALTSVHMLKYWLKSFKCGSIYGIRIVYLLYLLYIYWIGDVGGRASVRASIKL